jgi:hypothetical protein
LPVTCLLLGLAVTTLARLSSSSRLAGMSVLASGLFVAALGWVTWENHALWFEMPPKVACMAIYPADPFVECVAVGEFIREQAAPGDRIAVVGSEPEIYFYAQRRSVTGYIYMYDLVALQPFASAMQRTFIQEIESARPEFLVVVNSVTSWGAWPGADQTVVDWSRSYPGQFYNLAGVAAMYPSYTEYIWGKEAATATVKTPSSIYVYKRK